MSVPNPRGRTRATAVRAALAGALIVAGYYAATPAPARVTAKTSLAPAASKLNAAVRPNLAASPKPDASVDLGNTGAETVAGPPALPSQVFNQSATGATAFGVTIAADGGILFDYGDATVAKYTPAGVQKWSSNLGTTLGGNDASAPPSFLVASSDGNDYVVDDAGNVFKINDSTGSGTTTPIFADSNGAQTTLKVDDATHNLYFGDLGGNMNSISTAGASHWQTPGTGSIQVAGPCTGKNTNVATKKFFSEPAYDGAGNLYFAEADQLPAAQCAITLGTLYKVNATTGAIVWSAPLVGKPTGAVALTSSGLIIATTQAGYVQAFNTAGAQQWSFNVGGVAFRGGVAVDQANNVVYVADTSSTLYAINESAGTAATGFNGTGTRAIAGGATGSAVVDSAHNVYVDTSTGALYGFSTAGAQLFNLATGAGAGAYSIPAIDASSVIYVGGTLGFVKGFQFNAAAATATSAALTAAAQTSAAQTSAAQTAAVQTATAGANANNTATAAAGQTQTAATATSAALTAAAQTSAAQTSAAQTSAAGTSAAQTSAAGTAAAGTANAQNTAAAQTASAQQTAAAATASAGGAPNCQLFVLPNPETIQRGGSEAILIKALPSTAITVTIVTTATPAYPATATLYRLDDGTGKPVLPGQVINGTAVTNGFQFTFNTGTHGRALLDFSIPANAPIEKVQVTATANEACNSAGKSSVDGLVHRGAVFNVEAQQASSFGLREFQSTHNVRIRSVELPPVHNSVVTDRVRILTAPGAVVTTTFAISGAVGSLGTAADGGTAYSNGQVFFQNVSTASATGGVHFGVPVTSTLLIPGKGGVIKVTVQSNTGGKTSVFKTSKPVREVRLRLLVQPQETTRGNRRATFQVSHKTSGTSLFTVLALCDPNSHVSGTAALPSDGTGANLSVGPITCGAGGRAKLKFNVPNNITTDSAHRVGLVTVTSQYRGATITRSIKFTYSRKVSG
jgi:hypothetical protein